jgi:spore coat protein U-like protein
MKTNTALQQRTLKLALIAATALATAAWSGAASAAVANGSATATVVSPITITKTADLSFGRFIPSAALGTVAVNTDGTRSFTGGVVLSTGGTAAAAAKFDITGQASSTYTIAYSAGVSLTNGTGGSMALTQVSDLAGTGGALATVATGTLSAGGAQSLYIGGTLAVAANQAAGNYTGAISATVDYN